MSIIDSLLSLVAPHVCLGCNAEGSLLCVACSADVIKAPGLCYRCWKPSLYGLTCNGCSAHAAVFRAQAICMYEGPAKQLVLKLKFGSAQAAVKPMAAIMATRVPQNLDVVIVPVPTATSRRRKRGYDQAILLAQRLAGVRRVQYVDCLRRLGQAHQVGANRAQRTQQLRGAFVVACPSRIYGQHVVLIDDVMTTGATFEAAAQALIAVGAQRVSALAFARPFSVTERRAASGRKSINFLPSSLGPSKNNLSNFKTDISDTA